MSAAIAAYEVNVFNTATASENKIHDDAMARRFGFRGGLVPGVEVFAYMAHMPVARWGRSWLERGQAECRFLKPVYDGAVARVTATEDGEVTGTLRDQRPASVRNRARFHPRRIGGSRPRSMRCRQPHRPPSGWRRARRHWRPGRALGITPVTIDRAMLGSYLDDIRETEPIYRAEGLVHPGQMLRLANQALVQNVVLGPWIHVGSKLRNHAAVAHRPTTDAAFQDHVQCGFQGSRDR